MMMEKWEGGIVLSLHHSHAVAKIILRQNREVCFHTISNKAKLTTSDKSYNSCIFIVITFIHLFDGLIIQSVRGNSFRNSLGYTCWTGPS